MGNVPWQKPILLRRPAHDGATRSGVLHQCDPDHWHKLSVLCVRVSELNWFPSTSATTAHFKYVYLHTALDRCMVFSFSCPYLSRRVTPVIPIISGVLFLFVIGSLFKTSFTDPGIIPRATADEAAYIEKQVCKCCDMPFLSKY